MALQEAKCKKCRREGEKLFLKGERCHTAKCGIVKRKFPPGAHGAKRMSRLTEYGEQLRTKQKLKKSYGLMEKQFSNYYKKAHNQEGDTGENMLRLLETRFDNVVYRLGLTKSRSEARQWVGHGHFRVNGKKMDIPSYEVKSGDVITLKEGSVALSPFKGIEKKADMKLVPTWIKFDNAKLEAKVLNVPVVKELMDQVNVKAIVEFYSR